MHGAWRTRGTWRALRWWWALLPWTLVRVALQQLPQTAGLAFGLTLLFTSGVTVHGLILGVTGLVFIITRHFVLGYVGLRRNERQSVSEGEFTGFFLLVHAVFMCSVSRASKRAILACGLGVCLGVCPHSDFLPLCFHSRLRAGALRVPECHNNHKTWNFSVGIFFVTPCVWRNSCKSLFRSP